VTIACYMGDHISQSGLQSATKHGLERATLRNVRFMVDSSAVIMFFCARLVHQLQHDTGVLRRVCSRDSALRGEAEEVLAKFRTSLLCMLREGSPNYREFFQRVDRMREELLRDTTSLAVERRKGDSRRLLKHLDRPHLSEDGWALETMPDSLVPRRDMATDICHELGLDPQSRLTDESLAKVGLYYAHLRGAQAAENDRQSALSLMPSANASSSSASRAPGPSDATKANVSDDSTGGSGGNEVLYSAEEGEFVHTDPTEDSNGKCVACQESDACFVGASCGHLIYCLKCRRAAIYRRLKDSTASSSGVPQKRQLQSRHLERTVVDCPLCRQEGRLIRAGKFEGWVYST